MFKNLFIPLLLIALSPPASADTPDNQENHFEKASAYTVKVRTRIEYPFAMDKKGSLSGAGFLINKKLGWIATNAHVYSRNMGLFLVAGARNCFNLLLKANFDSA